LLKKTEASKNFCLDGLIELLNNFKTIKSLGKMKQGGLGTYPNLVHYDIRGTKARW
jgi:uncharacterized protein YcbK (DUF882 family)